MFIRPFIFAGLMLSACTSNAALPSAKAIRDSLNAAWRPPADSVVSIRQLAPGVWSEVYLFEPYTPVNVIADCVGATRVSTDGIESRDDIDLWIFRRPDSSLVSRSVSRGSPTLDTAAASAVYRASATFRARNSQSGGWRFMTPVSGMIRRCSWRTTRSGE